MVLPLPSPVPPSPDTSKALIAAFAERNISFLPNRRIAADRCRASGRQARRRRGVAVRSLPRRAQASCAGCRRGERHDRGRLGPGQSRARSRRNIRTSMRSATSPTPARRRPASSPRARQRRSPRRSSRVSAERAKASSTRAGIVLYRVRRRSHRPGRRRFLLRPETDRHVLRADAWRCAPTRPRSASTRQARWFGL